MKNSNTYFDILCYNTLMSKFFETINKNEILKYLNYRSGEIDDDSYKLIDESIVILKRVSRPKYIFEIFNVEDAKIQRFLVGDDLNETLNDSHKIVFIVATLGQEIEMAIRRYSFSNLALSVVLDAAASAGVESVMNDICEKIRTDEGMYTTDRFSPGYGDMPLSMQKDFLSFLNAQKRVGIKANENGIMIPRKSVTAIMGISKFPQKHRHRGCENCRLFLECELRKRGHNCGYIE